MPKHDKKKANSNKARKGNHAAKRDLPIADDEQGYAQVTDSCGNRRFKVVCQDGVARMGHLRGKIRKRKKTWLTVGSWLIYAERTCFTAPRKKDLEKVDIIEILSEDEVRCLENMGEIIKDSNGKEDEDQPFEFAEDEKKEIDFDDI